MAEPVDWNIARRVARRSAKKEPPISRKEWVEMEKDFAELTAQAEGLVERQTGLRSLAGPARSKVVDRAEWVDANLASFRRLLGPVLDKLASRSSRRRRLMAANPLGPQLAGAEMGLLLGWMSSRVLGQYDQLIMEDDTAEDQDMVYFVGPNVLSLERKYGFPSREFRLWLALHEVTHRAQFTGVPWMREHFLSLVSQTIGGIDPDPRVLLEALRRAASDIRAGRNPLEEGGILAVVANPEQREAINRIAGMMSLLEGHGDITMDRAGADLIPSAARFGEVLRERRRQAGVTKVVSALIGLDAKLRQYEAGENFIREVEAKADPQLLERVWEGPDWLPSLAEIKRPTDWIARVAPPGAVALSS